MSKFATANWQGTGKEGTGTVTTETGALQSAVYTFATRFGDSREGTNPEELIAAAHASCFSMKLSFVLNEAGFTADSIVTRCEITFGDGIISKSHLTVKAKVPEISQEKFTECAEEAKKNCPVSKSLNDSIEITLDSTLE